MDAIRVVIADDSALFREGMRGMLRVAGFDVAGLASDVPSLGERIEIVGGCRFDRQLMCCRVAHDASFGDVLPARFELWLHQYDALRRHAIFLKGCRNECRQHES